MALFPFNNWGFPFPTIGRANFNTLPTVAVTVGTENVTLELPNHAFRNRSYVGGFYVDCIGSGNPIMWEQMM